MAQNILSTENAFKKMKIFPYETVLKMGKNGKVSDFSSGIVVKKISYKGLY